jgi:hypothetical protein
MHGCLEIPDLFLVLNMISHSFAALTREISCSTLEINLVFPRTHVLFSIYICVQPCITIFISYSHNKSYNDLLLFVYLSMILQINYLSMNTNVFVIIVAIGTVQIKAGFRFYATILFQQ